MKACQKYSGRILPFVGTVDTAQDLDRIRAALGDEKLTFIGHSYGTLLGATYAEMYPSRVRAMVLDGAIDPALGHRPDGPRPGQGFRVRPRRLLHLVRVDVVVSVADDRPIRRRPLAVPDRRQSRDEPSRRRRGASRTGGALRRSSRRPVLPVAVALSGGGPGPGGGRERGRSHLHVDQLRQWGVDQRRGRQERRRTASTTPSPVSRRHIRALAATAAAQAPVFGPVLAWGTPPVRGVARPAHAGPRQPITAVGSPPILVVGTTGDPATPYVWAVDLARQLQHGELVTWQGENHVAYFYSPCVRAIDQAYLVSGTLPPGGTTCRD